MQAEKVVSIIGKGTTYLFVAVVINYFIGFFFRVFIAQTLGAEALGIVALMLMFIGIFGIIFNLGLSGAVTKYIASFLAKKKEVDILYSTGLKMVFVLTLTGSVVLFMISEYLAVGVFKSPFAVFPFQLTSIALFFQAIQTFFKSCSSGYQRLGNIAITDVFERGSNLVIVILLVYLGFGIMGPVYSILLSFVIALLVSWVLFRHIAKLSLSGFDSNIARMLFKFGIPMAVAGGAAMVFSWADSFIIGVFLDVENVGFYSAAVSLYIFLGGIVGALATALFPAFSTIEAVRDKKMMREVINRSLKYTIYLILPASFGLFMLSGPTIRILFGGDFYSAVLPLQILVFGSLFLAVSRICYSFIAGTGDPASYTRYMIFSGIINIILNVILIPLYGLVGAAIATTISLFILFLLTIVFVHKRIGIGFGYLPKPIISTAVMLFVIFLIRSYLLVGTWGRVVLVMIAGVVVYCSVLYTLKGFDETDKRIIGMFFAKIRKVL